jgi:hypothetical protein
MDYFKVPVNDGVLDIDYDYLQEGVQISAVECLVLLRPGATVRPSWQAITVEEFNAAKEAMGIA